VLEYSPTEVQIATENLKLYKSPGIHQIPAGHKTLGSEVHKLINYILNKKKLSQQWKDAIIVPIYKKGNKIVRI
jgi:hypothetical protein